MYLWLHHQAPANWPGRGADRDGKLTKAEMVAGLAHLRVICPNSRCSYRPSAECTAAAAPAFIGASDSIDFCAFRKFFLLLPQVRQSHFLAFRQEQNRAIVS